MLYNAETVVAAGTIVASEVTEEDEALTEEIIKIIKTTQNQGGQPQDIRMGPHHPHALTIILTDARLTIVLTLCPVVGLTSLLILVRNLSPNETSANLMQLK